MAVQINSEESRKLRQLYPLTTYPSEAFKTLCENVTVERIQNKAIFKKGDTETELVYLLAGNVTLQSDGLIVDIISSDNESSKFALAHQIPRKIDAIANGVVHVVRLDAHTINNPPPAVYIDDQSYTVTDQGIEDSDDWMSAVLRLPLFQTLPPANLQKILINLRTYDFKAGNTVYGIGDAVDYFYIIQKGRCAIKRAGSFKDVEIILTAGDSFGDEYLITDFLSKETVTALGEVSLIQLEKKIFLSQIAPTTIQTVSQQAIPDALQKGAVLLDVRPPEQFENQAIKNSANIPLFSLRSRMAEIPRDKQVIVVCEKGRKSEAAAFLLLKARCQALVLEGGMGLDEASNAENVGRQVDHPSDIQNSDLNPVSALTTSSLPDDSSGTDLVNLKAENSRLLALNRELEQKITVLEADKNQAQNQCQKLTQQIDTLKEILARFTKPK